MKPICLLLGYLYKLLSEEEIKNPKLAKDLEKIMKFIPHYIDICV